MTKAVFNLLGPSWKATQKKNRKYMHSKCLPSIGILLHATCPFAAQLGPKLSGNPHHVNLAFDATELRTKVVTKTGNAMRLLAWNVPAQHALPHWCQGQA